MFKKIQYVYLLKKIYKMQHLEVSVVPVLYIGRTVPKGLIQHSLERLPECARKLCATDCPFREDLDFC